MAPEQHPRCVVFFGTNIYHLTLVRACCCTTLSHHAHCSKIQSNPPAVADQFLAYVQRFDIVPQVQPVCSQLVNAKGPHPDCASGMYVLRRAKHTDHTANTFLSDIVPLDQVQTLVELTPQFGNEADQCLTQVNTSA